MSYRTFASCDNSSFSRNTIEYLSYLLKFSSNVQDQLATFQPRGVSRITMHELMKGGKARQVKPSAHLTLGTSHGLPASINRIMPTRMPCRILRPASCSRPL
ncbi:hypothetical protein VTO42DRAFT_2327 [Malbranchea cinnamomea]